MNITICRDYEEASLKAYRRLLSELRKNPGAVLGLPTGSSPLGVYKCMREGFSRGDFSYNGITTFNLDEYAGMRREDSHSYYHFMMENLFSAIDVPSRKIHIPSGIGDLEQNCAAYEAEIETAGGIDIQLLGVGGNGHIGFNEPGTPFDISTHIAVLTEETRAANARFFNSIEEVPEKAVTMGLKNITEAGIIILIAAGIQKSDAVYRTVKGPVSTDCPSTILQKHGNVFMFIDREAASLLD